MSLSSFISYVWVFFLHVYLYTIWIQCLNRPEEGIWSPKARDKDCSHWETHLGCLSGQPMLLKLSLCPVPFVFISYVCIERKYTLSHLLLFFLVPLAFKPRLFCRAPPLSLEVFYLLDLEYIHHPCLLSGRWSPKAESPPRVGGTIYNWNHNSQKGQSLTVWTS